MKDIRIKNGDIDLTGTGQIGLIGGPDKIGQDLRQWMINDRGFNRFHNWIGASLDEFVGQQRDPLKIAVIRDRVRGQLDLYYLSAYEDLRRRVATRRNPTVAAAFAQPDSIVADWDDVQVWEDNDGVVVRVHYSTIAGETRAVTFGLTTGLEQVAISDQ